MLNFTAPIPLSLYIHLPWCVRKCPYCDFNSHTSPLTPLPEEAYVNALLRDLEQHLPLIWGRRLVSIFFGGGTPSLFSPDAIVQILQGVHARLPFGPALEITLEANPGTVDESRFAGFRAAGVNRLSLGIQSFNATHLQKLGRIHGQDQAVRAIEIAKHVGFDNFNLDIMYGLPNQSVAEAIHDLQTALAFSPPHLSWYQLTLEPNTLFYHQPPPLPNEDIMGQMQEQSIPWFSSLKQYEVSAYAVPDAQCAHNKNYWEFGDYLGIGAGAHSKITDVDHAIIRRSMQPKNPRDYLAAYNGTTPLRQRPQTSLAHQDIIFEFMLNALRLTDGVPYTLFQERTGLPITAIAAACAIAKAKKLLVDDGDKLCPTLLGQRFLNDLVGLFLPQKAGSF